jgi:imidazolonepropionase-like amidohydrolase
LKVRNNQTSGHFDFRGKNEVPANSTNSLNFWERNGVIMVADGVPEVMKRARENLRIGAAQLRIAAGGGVYLRLTLWTSRNIPSKR